MDENQRKAAASKLFDDLAIPMSNLYCRWQDEKGNEDIDDYAKPIQSTIDAAGGKIVTMKKRPFGFTFTLDDATYQIKVTSREYSYSRIS